MTRSDTAPGATAPEVFGPVATLSVVLDFVDPPVVRRLAVPLALRLDRLHLVIQAAMGWTDSHLWSLETGDAAYGPKLPFDDLGTKDAKKATLAEVVDGAGGEPLLYTYDFGDGWEHLVAVEAIGDGEPGIL